MWCGQLPSMAFGLGGRAGPANPAYGRKKTPEVDNWTNWPPGQITGSTEDTIMKKRPASNPLQPNNKVKISAVSHPLQCRDVSGVWNSSAALVGSFLRARVRWWKLNLTLKKGTPSKTEVSFAESLTFSWVMKQTFPQSTPSQSLVR